MMKIKFETEQNWKKALLLCCFLCYTLSIFIIPYPAWTLFILALHLIIMLIFHTSFLLFLKSLLPLTFLLAATFLLNFILSDLFMAFTTTCKLILAYQSTYLFSKRFTYSDLAKAIEILAYPIKLLKKDPKDISLIICIAIAFLPILKEEFLQIKNVFVVKGFPINLKNTLQHPNLILGPFFIGILERVREIELSLKIKGYE